MKLIFALMMIPLTTYAVPENKVYPNSGATDARMDQQTEIINPSASPIDQGTGTVPGSAQEQQERPVVDPEAIGVGPYDKDGNYMHVHKKP